MQRMLIALGLGSLAGCMALIAVQLYLLDVLRHPPVPPASSPVATSAPSRPQPAETVPPVPSPAVAEARRPEVPTLAPAPTDSGAGQPAPRGVIPGLDVEALQVALQSLGFDCRPAVIVGRALVWGCEGLTETGARLSVHAEGLDAGTVRVVRATIQQTGPVSEFVSASFLGAVAGVPYAGAEPQRATQWVSVVLLQGGHTRLGGVHFEVGGAPRLRTLDIWADNP